jgi:fatty-acyl-CoA synthase
MFSAPRTGAGPIPTSNADTEEAALGVSVSTAPLTPLRFLARSAEVWADRPAVRDGARTWTYAAHHDRVRRATGVLVEDLGIEVGDRVATLLPNIAAMLELHYAVPGAGGVLVPLNTRLAPREYAYVLAHSGAKAVVAYAPVRSQLLEAIDLMEGRPPQVVWVEEADDNHSEYEALLRDAAPADLRLPDDELALLSINYTSGTTGQPKGVMTTHRGAYLHSLGVVAEAGLSPRSAYLWTLPMFHCNGWAYIWAVTAMGAKHVTLPQVDPPRVWALLNEEGVTHLCTAPTVLLMLVGAEEATPCREPVHVFVGGSPPAPALLARAAQLNMAVTHLYGLTETYGPIAVCAWNPDWDDRPPAEKEQLRARQGVATVVSERLRVVDEHMRDVPRDGTTIGEVVVRGNNVLLGYYRDSDATRRAFAGGWFHTGDLAVMHPDGYVELRDRLKDIVISGGENVSTIEVEQALTAHPAVAEVAVVGAPDQRWGEVPVAFVVARDAERLDQDELRGFARKRLARFKVPKRIEVVEELPKTATGKIQKFLLRERVGTM